MSSGEFVFYSAIWNPSLFHYAMLISSQQVIAAIHSPSLFVPVTFCLTHTELAHSLRDKGSAGCPPGKRKCKQQAHKNTEFEWDCGAKSGWGSQWGKWIIRIEKNKETQKVFLGEQQHWKWNNNCLGVHLNANNNRNSIQVIHKYLWETFLRRTAQQIHIWRAFYE